MISSNSLDQRVNDPHGLKSRLSYFDLNRSILFQCLGRADQVCGIYNVISHKTVDHKGHNNVISIGLYFLEFSSLPFVELFTGQNFVFLCFDVQ